MFLSQVRPLEPAPLPAVKANKMSTHICRFAFHTEEFFEFQQPTFRSHVACVMLGDLSGQCLTVTGVFVSGGQAGLWLLSVLSYLRSSNPHVIVITCIYYQLFLNAVWWIHCFWTSDRPLWRTRVCVSCRTTSTWTRQRTSWWRTSWPTTKDSHTRRATVTVSNWIRRLWLRRASQAAANPQSVHDPCPSVLGGHSSGRAARGSPALHCRSQRNSNAF